MNNAATSLRRRGVLLALLALVAAAATAVLLSRDATPARAQLNDNLNVCKGHIQRGEADPDDPSLTVVTYRIACANPISGYQVQPDHEVQTYETEVFGTDKTGAVIQEDAFSCSGDQPGYGVNCVGGYRGGYDVLQGSFTIKGKLCKEPRVDPLLTVVRATIDSKGKPAQAISGPFDLGRPRGCKASKRHPALRIPR